MASSSMNTGLNTSQDPTSSAQKVMVYICAECHHENELSSRAHIRCVDCGSRIMYKKRTKRYVVFDAR